MHAYCMPEADHTAVKSWTKKRNWKCPLSSGSLHSNGDKCQDAYGDKCQAEDGGKAASTGEQFLNFFFLIFIYLAVPGLNHGKRDPLLWRVVSSSLTRDQTLAPYIRMES